MKLYKLGLLALTVSLVATVILLDKKGNQCCDCDNSNEDTECDNVDDIIVDESKF